VLLLLLEVEAVARARAGAEQRLAAASEGGTSRNKVFALVAARDAQLAARELGYEKCAFALRPTQILRWWWDRRSPSGLIE